MNTRPALNAWRSHAQGASPPRHARFEGPVAPVGQEMPWERPREAYVS